MAESREIRQRSSAGIEVMWQVSAESLFAGYVSGDPEAMTSFLRRFQGKAFGLALLITHDAAEAQDVAQEAFVRAWRYGGSYDPCRGSVSIWLLRIVRNLAIDRMRIKERRREVLVSELAPTILADALDVEEDAATRDVSDRIVAHVRSLPREQQDALLAVTLCGLSAREFSDIAGLPLGTVKTRIRLAVAKLRAELGAHVE
jgi:RNA polymerase sigma factor (sigma-70 family)